MAKDDDDWIYGQHGKTTPVGRLSHEGIVQRFRDATKNKAAANKIRTYTAAKSLQHPTSTRAPKGGGAAGRTSDEGASSAATGSPAKVTRNAKSLQHPLSTARVRGSASTSGREDLGPTSSSLGPRPRPKDMPSMGSVRPKSRPTVTGTPPMARPNRPAGGTARGEDLGPSTSAGTSDAKGPRARPASFTDRAKVAKEKTDAAKTKTKTKAAAKTGSAPKPRPASGDGKGKAGGLLGALRRNTDNQRLAKERQAKAGRKG